MIIIGKILSVFQELLIAYGVSKLEAKLIYCKYERSTTNGLMFKYNNSNTSAQDLDFIYLSYANNKNVPFLLLWFFMATFLGLFLSETAV